MRLTARAGCSLDDEESVRAVLGRILGHLGYTVDFASDGAEAIALFESAIAAGRAYRGVLMDLTIPGGMGGKEAVTRVLELDPHARVIVSSGYDNDLVIANFRRYGFSGAIAKPFLMNDLARVLQEVLDPPRTAV